MAIIAGYDPLTHFYQNASYQPPQEMSIRLPAPQAVKDQNWPTSQAAPVVPCCVSCAIVSAVEYLRIPGWDTSPLSPLYHYYQARLNKNALTMLNALDGILNLLSAGVCRQNLHSPPMSVQGAQSKPSPEAITNATGLSTALTAHSVEYATLFPVNTPTLQSWLSEGYPVVAEITLTAAYYKLTPQNPVHGPGTPSGSNHVVLLIGFSETTRRFLVQDSRGPGFAQAGYWHLPYNQLNAMGLVTDAWGLWPQLP